MSEAEKKAIEELKFCLTTNGEISIYDGTTMPVKVTDIQILLNLLSKKDKVIDLMALHIASSAIVDDMVCMYKDCENENCTADMAIQCTKEYFCKKVEEEK